MKTKKDINKFYFKRSFYEATETLTNKIKNRFLNKEVSDELSNTNN